MRCNVWFVAFYCIGGLNHHGLLDFCAGFTGQSNRGPSGFGNTASGCHGFRFGACGQPDGYARPIG
jgi:hypothetical protein